MADIIKSVFTNNQTITIVLNGLPNNSTAVSAIIDNSTNKFMNAEIQIKIKTGIGTTSDGSITALLLRSADNGVSFDDADIANQVLGMFIANVDDTSYIMSINTANLGFLPKQWKLAIKNETGATLNSSASNFHAKFDGKYFVAG